MMHYLYYSPGACSLATHIVLEELGIPYQLELRSAVGGKGTQTADYLAINPKGRVPALIGVSGSIGGAPQLLTETSAILFYLAQSFPQSQLLPSEAAAQARCIEWLSWLSSSVHALSYGQIWRPERFVANSEFHDAVRQKGMQNVLAQYDYVEELLADGRDWAVPGSYTVVDPYLLVFWHWGRLIDVDMRERYPAWACLTAKILSRSAVSRALEQEGLLIV